MTRVIPMDNLLGSGAGRDRDQDRVRRVSELKKELRKLVHLITDDGECRIELFDQIFNNLNALKDIKFKKQSGGQDEGTVPARTLPEKLHNIDVPAHFLCPISSELMRDPVVVASGQTYERAYIQAWLKEGHRTCPKTQQVLPHLILTPNHLIRNMITQWSHDHGLEPRPPVTETTSDETASSCTVTPQDRKHVQILLDKISLGEGSREAARELRSLTKSKPSHRIFLAEAVPLLVSLLSSPDSETQEHAVTTLLNLSIHEPNKTAITAGGAIPGIIEVLEKGTAEAQANAAAALFSLSAVDENKAKIGAAGAIPPLVDLLLRGTPMSKKDAASALFNLCIHHANRTLCVRAGMIPALLNLVSNEREALVDESLAVLAIVAAHPEAAVAMGSAGALPCLMGIIRGNFNQRNKENAVVILYAICSNDRSYLRELRTDEICYDALVDLSENGTSRARRKACGILDRMRRRTERMPTM